MSPLSTDPEEWIEQAEHDLKAAEFLSKSGYRYYAIFLCHLAVEKALKGLYFKRTGNSPPKTHNLISLLEKIGEIPPQNLREYIMRLNEAHLITRYPEDIKILQKEFSKKYVQDCIKKGEETIEWIKMKF